MPLTGVEWLFLYPRFSKNKIELKNNKDSEDTPARRHRFLFFIYIIRDQSN